MIVVTPRRDQRSRRAAALAVLLATVTSCDPGAAISARTMLRPIPQRACIDSAIASPAVVAITGSAVTPGQSSFAKDAWLSFWFDDASPRANGYLTVESRSDSAADVTAGFGWVGRLSYVPDSTRATLASRATAIVQELQRACSKSTPPDAITCEQTETRGPRLLCS